MHAFFISGVAPDLHDHQHDRRALTAHRRSVRGEMLQRNGRSTDFPRNGIEVVRGAIRNNVVDASGLAGIAASVGSVSYNVSTRNGFGGINLGNGTSYVGNVFRDNAPQDVLGAGVNLGQNLCGLTVCPGAQF